MVFKCKTCGGNMDIEENSEIITCEYCGTKQTLPKLESDKIANLYDRANHFRYNNEYDKAEALYEMILNENPKDAESYWSLILCKYGIEYVKDPKTKEYIPTCNRTQNTSIFADENYKQALKYGTEEQKEIYKQEAEKINSIQKGILEISKKEEPYDIFICYKETDNDGNRTGDSVIAQELFYQLQKEGFRVFFSKITLENKIGESYEPYIYGALNSSKVMIVIGSKKEYFEAPWVKNEWSRYLSLIKNGEEKTVIPCFKDMDAYELPEEFAYLQAQDMSKIGFEQDLVYGIKKIINKDNKKKKTNKPLIISVCIIVALLIFFGIMLTMNKDNNNVAKEAKSVKQIIKESTGIGDSNKFNITVDELKDKLMAKLASGSAIEARQTGYWCGGDGEEVLGIGYFFDTDEIYARGYNGELQANLIGLVIFKDFKDDYVYKIECLVPYLGEEQANMYIEALQLYKEAKKILGSETEEWKQLQETGIIKETIMDNQGKELTLEEALTDDYIILEVN